MDWQLAITRNRTALTVIITALMASVGLTAGAALTTLPHFLYRRALLIIRPAESALRRVIMIAALMLTQRGIVLPRRRPRVEGVSRPSAPSAPRAPVFNLIDPLKVFGREAPDFSAFGPCYGDDYASANLNTIPAEALGRRILALKHALESIPEQAKRLARWYAQRDLERKQNKTGRTSPLRPSPPPGAPRIKRTEMDKLLLECHLMAIYAREQPDSS
jgi:hypothetical protein